MNLPFPRSSRPTPPSTHLAVVQLSYLCRNTFTSPFSFPAVLRQVFWPFSTAPRSCKRNVLDHLIFIREREKRGGREDFKAEERIFKRRVAGFHAFASASSPHLVSLRLVCEIFAKKKSLPLSPRLRRQSQRRRSFPFFYPALNSIEFVHSRRGLCVNRFSKRVLLT